MPKHSFDAQHTARLAKLRLSPQQADNLGTEIEHILAAIDQLQTVNTDQVLPLSNPHDATQPLRDDNITEHNQREQLQASASETSAGLYLVPQVIDQASNDES